MSKDIKDDPDIIWSPEGFYMGMRKTKDDNIVPITPDTPTNMDGLTFSEALEQSFWQSGGIALLNRVAKEEPLEFIKICAKLIPVEMKGIEADKGVTVIINSLDEKTVPPIEHKD